GIGTAEFVPEIERSHRPREDQVATAAHRNKWRALRIISSSICRLDRAAVLLNEKMAAAIAPRPSSSGARSSTYARSVSRSYSARINLKSITCPMRKAPAERKDPTRGQQPAIRGMTLQTSCYRTITSFTLALGLVRNDE